MASRLPARVMLVAALAMAATGCARQIGGETYDGGRIGAAVEARLGTIQSARYVRVQEGDQLQDNVFGGVVGGAAGGAGGAAAASGLDIGGSAGRAVAIGLGAAAGSALGALGQRQLSQQTAIEYLVRLDTGNMVTVVQTDAQPIPPGSRVYVQLGGGGQRARVVPA